jgi:hypothetical protein
MRRGVQGAEIRRTSDGRLESVNLGADFCAEHEWGSKELDRDLGLDPSAPIGIERRRVRDVRFVYHLPKQNVIYMDRMASLWSSPQRFLELKPYGDEPFVGAWSGGDFGVWFSKALAQDEADLWDAFQSQDVALLFGNVGDNPFARGGLALCIISRLPQAIPDSIKAQMEDQEALDTAVKATGIMDRLEDWKAETAGSGWNSERGWYALSPSWANHERTEVRFWLNPYDQKNRYWGYVTVADLDDWIAGKGKIMSPRDK